MQDKLQSLTVKKIGLIAAAALLIGFGAYLLIIKDNNKRIPASLSDKQENMDAGRTIENDLQAARENQTESLATDEGSDQNGELYDNRIASWKVYRNEEYGFEIKYPAGFEVKENNPVPSGEDWDGSGIDKAAIFDFDYLNSQNPIVNPLLRISVSDKPLAQILERYKQMAIMAEENGKVEEKNILIAGKNGAAIDGYTIVQGKDAHVFLFESLASADEREVSGFDYNKVLSTFEFLQE